MFIALAFLFLNLFALYSIAWRHATILIVNFPTFTKKELRQLIWNRGNAMVRGETGENPSYWVASSVRNMKCVCVIRFERIATAAQLERSIPTHYAFVASRGRVHWLYFAQKEIAIVASVQLSIGLIKITKNQQNIAKNIIYLILMCWCVALGNTKDFTWNVNGLYAQFAGLRWTLDK